MRVSNATIDGTCLGPSEIHISYRRPRYWNLRQGETDWTKLDDVERMHHVSLLEIEDRKGLIVGRAAATEGWFGIRCKATITSVLPCHMD